MNTAQFAHDILTDAVNLPSPSPVLGRLVGLLTDPDESTEKVRDVVRLDPALSAHLLRVVNSVYYRRNVEVTSVERALLVLGREELIRITLGRLAGDLFPASVPGYGLVRQGMWQRSVRSAVAAEVLARRSQLVTPGLAYTAGLLLDIGKLALAPLLATRRDEILQLVADEPDVGFDEAERRILGADHAQLGGWLARRWGLPPALAEVIEHHHRPAGAPPAHLPLAYLVHLADSLALMTGGAAGVDGLQYPLCERWQQVLPLSHGVVMDLLVEIADGYEAAFRVLSLH